MDEAIQKNPSQKELLSLLKRGEIRSPRLVPHGSNYAFLVSICDGSGARCEAIYKPRSGERPLRDFPYGTLYRREYATYVVSQALGWPRVPATVIRDGPHGVGSVQLYVDVQPEASYFTLREQHAEELRRIAAFDLLVNNADRKAGHCLMGKDGKIWSIDHGLTFHPIFKLRTVIWDFCGEPIPEILLGDMGALLKRLNSNGGLARELSEVLDREEMEALVHRGRLLLKTPVFPNLDPYINVPWPWV